MRSVVPKMENKKVHVRHILLFYFQKGTTAAEAHRKICGVYGEDYVSQRTCGKWFVKFRSGDLDLEDDPRSGGPVKTDDNEILVLIQNDPNLTTQEIADRFNINRTTVGHRLRKLGYVKKLNVWIRQNNKINEKNARKRHEHHS